MKRFIPNLICLLLIFAAGMNISSAQTRKMLRSPEQINRCGTEDAIMLRYRTDPEFRAMMDERERQFQEWRAQNAQRNTTPGETSRQTNLTGPVTIPIVIHVVLPNPNVVLESDIDYFVNRLNLDFSGLNPDSTNGSAFYGVRGHSLIRWCLARRDPAGNFTNGIERRVGAGNIAGGEPQPIKSFAQGGLDPWDVTKYYNVWVGQGGGLLGIAPQIGPGTAANDGVCLNWQSFSNNPCYTIGQFNLGRTAVHEIGHNFGLWHTFQGGCANQDVQQLTSTNCTLPGSILGLGDDTPALSAPTSGCPSGNVAGGCSVNKQYQNYMDYTDDACYSMFTNIQVARMHWVLENCRAGYLTSNGCQLPAGTPALDGALIEVVSPGGSELVGCTLVSYTVAGCSSNFAPKVRIQNRGATTITGVKVQVTTPTGTTTQTVSVNIPYSKSEVVTLGTSSLNVGSNTVTFTLLEVNTVADPVAANNTISTTVSYAPPASVPVPVAENFVSTTFPPAAFTVVNPNSNNTWVRNANGNGNAGSAFIDNYNFNLVGQVDELRTRLLTLSPLNADSLILTFDLAHKNFPGLNDRLQVLVSSDCGTTFTATGTNPVFDRSGATLATAGASTANYTTPAAADWRGQRVAIYIGPGSPFATAGNIIITFKMTNGYGNNVFLDNINISKKVGRDLLVSAVTKPGNDECGTTFAPQITVRNNGAEAITQYKIGHVLDNGTAVVDQTVNATLNPGATANFTLPAITAAAGNHNFRAFTADPVSSSGSGDQAPGNDTLNKAFRVRTLLATAGETFEGLNFPSTDWTINNPNANVTWVKTSPGRASSKSMFIDNYNFNLVGQTDDYVTPPIACAGADSVVISFDVAHKNFPGLNDILSVLTSSDCGNTFTVTSYVRPGNLLATAGTSTAAYTNPAESDWRRDRVMVSGAALAAGNVIFAIRNQNGYGNNIYIDNINITVHYKRDMEVTRIVRPTVECTQNVTPSVVVTNKGSETITGFTLNYSIDGGALQSANFTGLSIASNATATFALPVSNGVALGGHNILAYSTALVTTGGTGDQYLANDSTRSTFTVLGTQAAPLVETFEGTFPPTKWAVTNPDLNITWSKQTIAGNSSASMQNFTYTNAQTQSQEDKLITPVITYGLVDSVYLSFDLAAATRRYPGSTQIALDTLEVMLTKDCGNTFTTIWKKWGEDLQTINDPNYSNILAFVPASQDWKNFKMNITGAAGTSANNLYITFRSASNADNNVYVDNVNLSTLTLPERLKSQGYLLYPNPFSGSFNVQHFLPPTDLRYIEVFNARGQLVYRKGFGTGGANSTEGIDLSNLASGVYTVKLGYTNKQIVERIIKTNR